METLICLLCSLPFELCKILLDNICIINIFNILDLWGFNAIEFTQHLSGLGCFMTGPFILDCYLNHSISFLKIDVMGNHILSFVDSKKGSSKCHPFEMYITGKVYDDFKIKINQVNEEKTPFTIDSFIEYRRTYNLIHNQIRFSNIMPEFNDFLELSEYDLECHNIGFNGTIVEYRDIFSILNKQIKLSDVLRIM